MATGLKTGGRTKGTENKATVARRAAAVPELLTSAGAREALGESGPAFPPYRLARLADLIPNPRNARTHAPESVDALCAQITANGWTAPMLVAGKHILAGHRRRLAGLKLALDVVPVIDLSHLSANERRAYIIWDNQSVIAGSAWDTEVLSLELGELKDLGFDLSLSGFDGVELDALFGMDGALLDPGSADDAGPVAFDAAPGDKVCCPACGYAFATVDKRFREIAARPPR
jgi:hypothetical protein